MNDLAHVYVDLALWPEDDRLSDEAAPAVAELGNPAMLADSLATSSLYNSLQGELPRSARPRQRTSCH